MLRVMFPCSYLRDSGLDKQVILKDMRDFKGHTHKSTHTLSLLTLGITINLKCFQMHAMSFIMFSKISTKCEFQNISVALNLLLKLGIVNIKWL